MIQQIVVNYICPNVERDGIPLSPLASSLGGVPLRPTRLFHQLIEAIFANVVVFRLRVVDNDGGGGLFGH